MERKKVLTPGANGIAFTEGYAAINKLRELVKYFSSPQRRDKLIAFAEERGHNNYAVPKIDGDTRVASCHKMIQEGIFNYVLFDDFFNESNSNALDRAVFLNFVRRRLGIT